MPYVEGESLREKLNREKPLAINEALEIAKTVAGALGYAHEQGVVHRDIKPENILLHKGEVLVADFGIALAVQTAGGPRLTDIGFSPGTPHYMSPEQAGGGANLDGRSDLYSLACVLFEMLIGEPPFTGPSVQAILARHMNEKPPSLRVVRATISVGVEQAVQKALAKVPTDRFAPMTEFADALARERTAKEKRPRMGSPLVVYGLLMLVTVVLAIGVISQFVASSIESPMVPTHRQITFIGDAGWPALSRDGEWLAYIDDRRTLVIQDLEGGGRPVTVMLPEGGYPAEPHWTDDGRYVQFRILRRSGTFRVPRSGVNPQKVSDTWNGAHAPQGVRVRGSLNLVVEVDGLSSDTIRTVFPPPSLFTRVVWDPTGEWFVVGERHVGRPTETRLLLVPRDGSSAVELFRFKGVIADWQWSQAGNAVYFMRRESGAEAEIVRLEVDPSRANPSGEPSLIMSTFGVQRFSMSENAKRIAYQRQIRVAPVWGITIAIVDGQPKIEQKRLTGATATFGAHALSQDGELLAAARGDGMDIIGPAGVVERRFTSPTGGRLPKWAPGGNRLAFVGNDTDACILHIADLTDGSVRSVDSAYTRNFCGRGYAWSASGQQIFLQHAADTGPAATIVTNCTDLVRLQLEDNTKQSILRDFVCARYVAVSPDGGRLALGSVLGTDSLVRIVELEDGSIKRIQTPSVRVLGWLDDDVLVVILEPRRNRVAQTSSLYGISIAREEVVWQLPDVPCSASIAGPLNRKGTFTCLRRANQSDIWLVENFDPWAQ